MQPIDELSCLLNDSLNHARPFSRKEALSSEEAGIIDAKNAFKEVREILNSIKPSKNQKKTA